MPLSHLLPLALDMTMQDQVLTFLPTELSPRGLFEKPRACETIAKSHIAKPGSGEQTSGGPVRG